MTDSKKKHPKPHSQDLELEKVVEQLKEALESERSKSVRALADLENLRRRESENKKNWVSSGIGMFLKQLLPVFLELQLGAGHSTDKSIQEVTTKFFGELEKAGLKKICPAEGDDIDLNLHEVLLTEEGQNGKIVRVLEPGWVFQDITLSPAKVSATPA